MPRSSHQTIDSGNSAAGFSAAQNAWFINMQAGVRELELKIGYVELL